MPRTQNAAEELVIVEPRAPATTIEHFLRPGDFVTAVDGVARSLGPAA